MADYDAKLARTRKPLAIWVDDFQSQTSCLQPEQCGCYFRLLMAMWKRTTCDFPDDDSLIAHVCGVSTIIWKRRIAPSVRPLLRSENGFLFSDFLRKEASFSEDFGRNQSEKKSKKGKKIPSNPLNDKDPPSTGDDPGKILPLPTYQPTNRSK